MKTIILYLTLATFTFASQLVQSQENSPKSKEEIIQDKRDEIIKDEKEKLRVKVETYNAQVKNGVITEEEAEKKKKEAAEFHAKNIENRIAVMENQLEYDSRNNSHAGYIALSEDGLSVRVNNERERKYDKRTTSDIVIAAGFNNALTKDQSLNDSDFKIGGSRFFEIGWAWKTRVFDNSNWLRFKYGFSFQFNGLKPTDNRYFVNNDGAVSLEEYQYDLDKSKFRTDYLVAPVHFEFGPSERHETDRSLRFSTKDKFRIGLGGYAGFSLGERQKLKYSMDGDDKKEKLKGDYNTNDFIYGLSAYMGWGGATLYAKYDLNPLFDDPNPEMHNFSIGLRFDVD